MEEAQNTTTYRVESPEEQEEDNLEPPFVIAV